MNFENAWQERFDNLAIEPDEKVWIKIDAALANKDTAVYKKKLFYFELAAAASVIIMIGLAYYAFNSRNSINNDNNQRVEKIIPGINKNNPTTLNNVDKNIKGNGNPIANNSINKANTGELKLAETRGTVINNAKIKNLASANSSDLIPAVDFDLMKCIGLKSYRKPFFPRYPGFINSGIYETVVDTEIHKKPLWAGICISSGIFDPNISYGQRSSLFNVDRFSGNKVAYSSYSPSAINSSSMAYPTYNPDISYSYGAKIGFELGKRWLIQTGINYMFASGSAAVNTYLVSQNGNKKFAYQVVGASTLNSYHQASLYSSSSDIQLNSNFEFITIPVTAGYILYDHIVRWTVDAGVSPEILLKTTIVDEGNFLNTLNLNPGENSPFKPVYFNGLVGTSVNLVFLKNYQFNLSPAYNFGIDYLTKKNYGFNSRPSCFMVSGGLAYIFNE